MLKRITLSLLVASFIFAGAPAQDSALHHFPDSTALMVEVDMPAMLHMLKQLRVDDFAEEMKHEFVEDLLNRIDAVYVGLPEGEFEDNEDLYVLMRSDLTVQELIDMAVKYDEEDHEVDIRSTTIGPFTAYYNAADEDDEMYVAEAGGFIVVGTKQGLLQYADVLSGKLANARANQELASLRSALPASSSIRVYGSTPKEMGHMFSPETIALGIGTVADNLNMLLRMTSEDMDGLDKLEQQINGLSGMAGMFDETGELAQLLETLEVIRENDAITLKLDVPIASLQDIFKGKFGDHSDEH